MAARMTNPGIVSFPYFLVIGFTTIQEHQVDDLARGNLIQRMFFSQVASWANDAAAVEKSLRLFQALAQIVAGISLSAEHATPWSKARGQFALARRYLRLFKWIDCSQAAKQQYNTPQSPFRCFLATTKFILLALYFFMEMFCITNAMTITSSPKISQLQHHALQTWFLAICASILLGSYDFLLSTSSSQSQTSIQLLIDFCDILIPGSAVGWIKADSVTVGVASSISSLVAGRQIWGRVREEARRKAAAGRIEKVEARSVKVVRDGVEEEVVEKVVTEKKRVAPGDEKRVE